MVSLKKRTFILFIGFILLLSTFATSAFADDNTEWEDANPGLFEEQTDEGDLGMVVSAHPEASKVGAQVLRDGGNAVDAAVAMQLALNVVEPMMSGIGGGGFMMYYDAATEDVSIINSREKAPGAATPEMFYDEDGTLPGFQDRVRSGKSVGVPGTLMGVDEAVRAWGTGNFDLSDLLQPAIKLAEDGVEINWAVGAAIAGNAEKLSKTAAADVFLNEDGSPLEEGDLLVQEDLAKTFKLIADQGIEVFYNGEIGKALAAEVQNRGGWMEEEDLANYDLSYVTPVQGEYLGYDIITMPPPSSGGLTMLQILRMAELKDLHNEGVRSYEKYHNLVEAMHLAYADRGRYMADPEFAEVPMEGLLNDEYLEERAALIDPDQANPDVVPGDPWAYQDGDGEADTSPLAADDKEDGETTHFTVADQWGNLVSYTTTIEQVFGSGIMIPGYGVMLNNELTDFDATPGGVNEVGPNKRPLSSMTPTIVLEDGKPFLTVGSPGGATIITSVTQTIMNVIGYDMSLKNAIEEPRIYSNAYPNIRWEEGIPQDVRDRLTAAGHTWENSPVEIGNVNSILLSADESGKTTYFGAADSTRQGSAIGIQSELDKSALQDRVNEITDENLNESDYTEESWAALDAALAEAKTVLADEEATQEAVDAALAALNDARANLEEAAEEVNKDELRQAIEGIEAENLNEADYTVFSWAVLAGALENAKDVLADEDATQKLVDEVASTLLAARENLEEVADETPEVNKSDLEAKVKELTDLELQEAVYTADSWKELQDALAAAQAVLADEEATQEQVDNALAALNAAYAGLEKKEKEGPKEEDPKDDGKEDPAGKDDSGKQDGEKLPSTATSSYNWMLAGLVLVVLAAVVWQINRRRRVQ